jgi:signal transduction histidine kinase
MTELRNRERIAAWAKELADALPRARPGVAIDHRGHALWRWAFYGVVGWALCAATMFALQRTMPMTSAFALHALAAPAIFALLSQRYFRARGARAPLPTALALSALVALLDATVVAQGLLHSLVMLTSFVGTWLPLALIFVVTWVTGTIMAMGPIPKPAKRTAAVPDASSASRAEVAQRLHSP